MIDINSIFNIRTREEFEKYTISVFQYQAKKNKIYKQFLEINKIDSAKIDKIDSIPFLPIGFFKSHKLVTGNMNIEAVFSSSGTTGLTTSKHYIPDLKLYEKSFISGFNYFYGSPEKYCIIALLPSYFERKGSSLIYMMEKLISRSPYSQSGFYLDNIDKMYTTLNTLKKNKIPTILVGVSFALLDFVEKYSIGFKDLIVMETGGMKGRREEITRQELHAALKNGFGVSLIHSEYGMTELLSQAYSKGKGIFNTPPWMEVRIRDIYDPRSLLQIGKTGGINIIDLANYNSISFIETQDLGKLHADNSFEVLGRLDNSDLRGCNLLVLN